MTSRNSLMILAGTLVVVLGLVGYFLYSQSGANMKSKTTDSQSAKLEKQSSSDETDSIEKDLNDTDLENIDKESVNIEVELESTN